MKKGVIWKNMMRFFYVDLQCIAMNEPNFYGPEQVYFDQLVKLAGFGET